MQFLSGHHPSPMQVTNPWTRFSSQVTGFTPQKNIQRTSDSLTLLILLRAIFYFVLGDQEELHKKAEFTRSCQTSCCVLCKMADTIRTRFDHLPAAHVTWYNPRPPQNGIGVLQTVIFFFVHFLFLSFSLYIFLTLRKFVIPGMDKGFWKGGTRFWMD